jgi:hypothetical protein
MTLNIASKKTILEQVKLGKCSYFAEKKFLEGTQEFVPTQYSPKYKNFQTRLEDDELTQEEKHEHELMHLADPIEERNDGDGRTAYQTYHFPEYDLHVSLVGWYFSSEGYEWDEVFLSEPYEHKEIRYKSIE